MQYEAQEWLVAMFFTSQKAVSNDRPGSRQCKTREVQKEMRQVLMVHIPDSSCSKTQL